MTMTDEALYQIVVGTLHSQYEWQARCLSQKSALLDLGRGLQHHAAWLDHFTHLQQTHETHRAISLFVLYLHHQLEGNGFHTEAIEKKTP
ncbi:MAG: hypothetical protein KTR14_01710 [Vampirovibrio sp.]|nr:hypothetical protein [Vampirovibrio sp.]